MIGCTRRARTARTAATGIAVGNETPEPTARAVTGRGIAATTTNNVRIGTTETHGGMRAANMLEAISRGLENGVTGAKIRLKGHAWVQRDRTGTIAMTDGTGAIAYTDTATTADDLAGGRITDLLVTTTRTCWTCERSASLRSRPMISCSSFPVAPLWNAYGSIKSAEFKYWLRKERDRVSDGRVMVRPKSH